MTQNDEKLNALPDELTTERLNLRRPTVADKADIVAALDNLNVTKWLSVVPHPYSDADADDFLEYCTEPGNQNYVIRQQGAFCGVIGLDGGNRLGFWLAEDFWGLGIMSEAVKVVIDGYFLAGNQQDLQSGYVMGNRGSERIHEKFGFVDLYEKVIHVKALGEDRPGMDLVLNRATWAEMGAS